MERTDWVTGEEVTATDMSNLGYEVNEALATATSAQSTADGKAGVDTLVDLPSTVSLTLVETSTGVWSADVPSRTVGEYPVVFVSWSDPTDATNGVTSPGNILDSDTWVQTDAPV